MKTIIIVLFLVIALNTNAKEVETGAIKDTIESSIIDSNKIQNPAGKYFAIGRGGSYGGIGLKFGRFSIDNDRYQSKYLITGLGGYEQNGNYKLGVLASVGKKFYFPDMVFIDTRAGIQEYTFNGTKFRPVIGVKCIGGIELRSNRIGISLGAGIAQNILFDQTTRPAIEVGFIFGNWGSLKKDEE